MDVETNGRSIAIELAKQVPSLVCLVVLVVYGLRGMETQNEQFAERIKARDAQLDRFNAAYIATTEQFVKTIAESNRVIGENSRVLAEVSRRLEIADKQK